jgi:hypothetical protein
MTQQRGQQKQFVIRWWQEAICQSVLVGSFRSNEQWQETFFFSLQAFNNSKATRMAS